jgi:hypothetical protein
MWQKRETKVIEVAGSQSGFPKKPFSPLMSTCVQFLAQRCWTPSTSGVWWGWGWGRLTSDWGWVMLLTHFIWQTDLKPLSGTNAKNGAITPSLTPTMHIIHARCYKASEWVGGSLQCRRGILVILWMSLVDVAVGDLVTCMSFVLWVCLRETWTVVETFLNTSWWNILYSGSSQEFIIRVTS